ncbi:hypothetical protein SBOR_9625 [Sclerotinia borealis F-4128]|uniref:Uncharacterized protein n=1 Tax=Sclerotinia borealis (strain F-4128) TaxID=1432307 RepID=W9C2R3_SCLBF|nr:hypothetical protein SBOR_9625 [Sclerotinia borealis F-4128]
MLTGKDGLENTSQVQEIGQHILVQTHLLKKPVWRCQDSRFILVIENICAAPLPASNGPLKVYKNQNANNVGIHSTTILNSEHLRRSQVPADPNAINASVARTLKLMGTLKLGSKNTLVGKNSEVVKQNIE